MRRTDAENAKRKEIVEKAVTDAVTWLAGGGYHMTPEQARTVSERLGLSIAQLHATEPTEALDLLVAASTLQTVSEVLGILAPADPIAWTLELVTVGGEAGRELLVSGGYTPTPPQLKQMARALRLRAEALVRVGMVLDPDRARADMRATAARVVRVVLGDPPTRVNLN